MSVVRVRAVVVDFNGGDITIDCLRHLLDATTPDIDLDIVLVDNASSRPVVDRVRREMPTVRVIRNPVNEGFAGGCNRGMEGLDADYVALVNNDVTVPPAWLTPLVATLAKDDRIGAASPKMLLQHRYRDVRLQSPTRRGGHGDPRQLGVRITGARLSGDDVWREVHFPAGTHGPELDAAGAEVRWTGADARLLVPARAGTVSGLELRLDAPVSRAVTAASADEGTTLQVGPDPAWFAVPCAGEPFDVVNNAGTELVAGGYGADRGWLERDRGQYDESDDVFAWCGGAVLLRADYLQDVGLFDEQLFLYAEDLELAWRGRPRGWRYRYVPASVVRHRHSATAMDAPDTAMLKERNRLLVLLRHGTPGEIAGAIARYPFTTASYARRDIVVPLRAHERVRPAQVRTRVRAFAGFLRLAPAMLSARRRDRMRTRPR
jgi:GT2 family glycosyltransferase